MLRILPKKIPSRPSRPKADAKPTAAIQAVADPLYAVPERVRALLGPSWLIEGEDPRLYEELLARVGAAIQPTDLIDWLLLKDVVALTWEIQRSPSARYPCPNGTPQGHEADPEPGNANRRKHQ